jgi:hypothetical protein
LHRWLARWLDATRLTTFAIGLSVATPSVSMAQASVEAQWGDLIDDVARLTWAEMNCSGRASDGVRELRLYLRKHANAEFEEAIIRNLTDTRETVDEARKVISEREAVSATCIGIHLVYGPNGNWPGPWQDNHAAPKGAVPPVRRDNTTGFYALQRFGEFAHVLARIHYLKSRCKGMPSTVAAEFTKAFIDGAGEVAFKIQKAHVDICSAPTGRSPRSSFRWATLPRQPGCWRAHWRHSLPFVRRHEIADAPELGMLRVARPFRDLNAADINTTQTVGITVAVFLRPRCS